MEEIPIWWLILSGAFYVFGIAMFAGLAFAAIKIAQVVQNLQPSIAGVAQKVEGVTSTVEGLTHKVEGITGKVEGIADTVKGIADSAKSVADTAKTTVQNVGNKSTQLVSNLSDRAEETLVSAQGSKVVNAVMMGLQVYNAVQHMRQHKNGQSNGKVDSNPWPEGTIKEHRGVEQPGSSSGS